MQTIQPEVANPKAGGITLVDPPKPGAERPGPTCFSVIHDRPAVALNPRVLRDPEDKRPTWPLETPDGIFDTKALKPEFFAKSGVCPCEKGGAPVSEAQRRKQVKRIARRDKSCWVERPEFSQTR